MLAIYTSFTLHMCMFYDKLLILQRSVLMKENIIQSIIDQITVSQGIVIYVIDRYRTIIASNVKSYIQTTLKQDLWSMSVPSNLHINQGHLVKTLFLQDEQAYALILNRDDNEAYKLMDVLSASFSTVLNHFNQKQDINLIMYDLMFSQNMTFDQVKHLLPNDFNPNEERQIVMIEVDELHPQLINQIRYFAKRNQWLIPHIAKLPLVLIRTHHEDHLITECENIIKSFTQTYYMGLGPVISDIEHIKRSYEGSKMCIDIARTFQLPFGIIDIHRLGIHKVIYQLPNDFKDTLLKDSSYSTLSKLQNEDLLTIHEFFSNNLSLSDTAKTMFVHRNTLVYRFERIKAITKLDIRHFDDAVMLYVYSLLHKFAGR